MKPFHFIASIIITVFLVSCQASVTSESPDLISGKFDKITGYSAFDEPNEFSALELEIERADFEFQLDDDDRLIPSGNRIGSPQISLVDSRDDRIFEGFVVVQLHKSAHLKGVDTRVSQVSDYFFSRSASRVLVTGFSGSGKLIYSEKTTKSNTSQ